MKYLVQARNFRILCLICLVLPLVLGGCLQGVKKDITEMTPKEKVTFFQQFYIAQYDDYQQMTALPDTLNEEQKTVLQVRRGILVRLEQAIDIYRNLVIEGEVGSSISAEQQITGLMNELTALAVGG